jgi:hypothetical protein
MEAESRYWDDHYARGGVSGEGSVGALRDFKWETIRRFCPDLDDVVDVGCGDLSFWDGQPWPRFYVGIDISKTVIERNGRGRFGAFICTPADRVSPRDEECIGRAEAVLCMDMLFHVMNDDAYERILENLCRWSDRWIFAYTWTTNPLLQPEVRRCASEELLRSGHPFRALRVRLGSETDYRYQKYRDFAQYFDLFERHGFGLRGCWSTASDPCGGLYVFRKTVS